MPRVKLSPDYFLIIARDQIRKSARQEDIAKILMISQSTACRKIKSMSFTLPELSKLIRAGVLEKEVVTRWFELV